MANSRYTRSLPKPPTSLPAYELPASPSSSPKPPIDLTFNPSVPSPPYAENASYAENTSFAENTPCPKNSRAPLSAAQQLYASSFTNRGPTIPALPPPSFETPRRHGHQQPSFYKNQVSSYVQQPTLRAGSPDSVLSSSPPSTNGRFISPPAHLRSITSQSPPYSGNRVSDGGLRTTPSARDFGPRPTSANHTRDRSEPDRSMIATEIPKINRTSVYALPQERRNLFPLTYVDTAKPRELRTVTTTVKPPPSFEASQSITSNFVGGPPHASAPLAPPQTGPLTQPLPVIVSPPPPPPIPLNAPQQFQQQSFAAPHPQGHLQPKIAPQRPPSISSATGSLYSGGTNRNRTSRFMNGITSLANSFGQLAVRSSVQSLLSGSSIEEGAEEYEGGDGSGASFLDYFGLEATGSISTGGGSEDLSDQMSLVPQFDASYGQDPSASFSVVLPPQFITASGGAQYNTQNANNTMNEGNTWAITHTYTGQSHLPVGAHQPYTQSPQQPAHNSFQNHRYR